MGHARRAKENKKQFKTSILVIIIVIIVVCITFYMIHDIQGKIENGNVENVSNIQKAENVIEEDDTENIVEQNIIEKNWVENEVVENTSATQSSSDKNEETVVNKTINESTNVTPGVTDEKQKAIELVKKEWGEDDTVNFVFDYVNENGEYVISVKDKTTATVRNYFRVDLSTQTVELD